MKMLRGLAILLACAVTVYGASSTVTFVDQQKVAVALEKGGTLVSTPDLIVQGTHRLGTGQVEVHDTETDVIYIVDGEATIVTGGTMIGGRVASPGQKRGSEIKDGESRHLTKGDVIVIPAGTPHWFKEVPQSISYYVVKVLKH